MPERLAHYVGQRCVGELPAKGRQTTTVMRAGVHLLLCYLVANQKGSTVSYGIPSKTEIVGRYEEVKSVYERGFEDPPLIIMLILPKL
jgi:hypothetical protein